MNMILSSRGLFILGFLVLIAVNIVVITGVAANRAGEPESLIILTERELQLKTQLHIDNSGLVLKLIWRSLGKAADNHGYTNWRAPAWLNAEKMKKLGFNLSAYQKSGPQRKYYKHPIPKEVFIVLEHDGAPYSQALMWAEKTLNRTERLVKLDPNDEKILKENKRATKRFNRERISETRLFAIDAGLNPAELRDIYADQSRFLITKGLVKARYDYKREKLFGYISRLSVAHIHVPLEYRQKFESLLTLSRPRNKKILPPRYEVTLAYGSRYEPWIISVELADNKTD